MRLCVQGHCEAARVLRTRLESRGYYLVPIVKGIPLFPDYTVYLDRNDDLFTVQIDSIDCSLERRALNLIQEQGVPEFILKRADGIKNNTAIHVSYPQRYEMQVERGLYQALVQELGGRLSFTKRLLAALGLSLLISTSASPDALKPAWVYSPALYFQNFPIVRFWDGTNVVNAGDFANNAVRVNVVASTGGGGAVDQGAGAGAATNFWNFRLTDGTNFYNALTDTQLRATPVPVSGTFFQATQPISGTVTANQGTAAASTAGWPDIQGTVAATTAAWTSATVVDTAISAATTGYGCILIDARISGGGVASGAIVFEASRDGGANYNPLEVILSAVVIPGEQITGMNYGLVAGSAYFERGISGFTNVRVRLNPVITGGGTVNLAILPIASECGGMPMALDSNGKWKIAIYNINQTPVNADNGASGLGTQRVTIANNSTGVLASIGSITTSVVPGTASTNLGKAEDAAHTSGDTGVFIQAVRTDPTTTAYTTANTEYSPVGVDYVGATYEGVHPSRFSCFVPSTATVTTQCQAAAAAGLRNYVTSAVVTNGVGTAQSVDIVFGTGAACVTGITAITNKIFFVGATQQGSLNQSVTFGENTPLVPTAATAICCRPTAATAFGCTITGFIAP